MSNARTTFWLGILLLASCKPVGHAPAAVAGGQVPAAADTAETTIEMRGALAGDLSRAERELRQTEEVLYRALDDSTLVDLREADLRWRAYRDQECSAVRTQYFPGTMAPVAQLDCLVGLTDQRRSFLRQAYPAAFEPEPAAAAPAAPRAAPEGDGR